MTKEGRIPNDQRRRALPGRVRHWVLVIGHSFVIRASSFVILERHGSCTLTPWPPCAAGRYQTGTFRREVDMSERDIKKPIRVGVYDAVADAERAVTRLLAAGFQRDEVTVICSDEHKEKFFRNVRTEDPAGEHTAAAAVTGGVVGAAIGGLALAASALVTGGATVLIAGPAIVGGSALAGTFTGAMMT